MTTPHLTSAQRRALEWLPSDGGWVVPAPGEHHTARRLIRHTMICHPDLIDQDRSVDAYRLTPAGIEVKKALMEDDDV